MNTPVRLVVSPTATILTSFYIRDFEALFTHAVTLICMVCLTPQLFLPVYPHTNVRLPAPLAAAFPGLSAATLPTPILQLLPCHESSPTWLPISILPTHLDECFFFNS